MSIARIVAPFAPIILASTAAVAQDPYDAPVTAASASASPSTVPSNAPIVLSPGVSATPKPVSAPKPVEARHEETRTPRAWFGWQTIAVDLIVVGTTAALLRTTDESTHLPIVLSAGVLYLGSGPLLHLIHGSGRADSSLIVRAIGLGAGSLVLGLIIEGFAGCTDDHAPCKLERIDFLAIGAGGGAMIASIIDGTSYAWRPLPGVTAHVAPMYRPMRGGGIGGLSITF
jgi:hypothetical protein